MIFYVYCMFNMFYIQKVFYVIFILWKEFVNIEDFHFIEVYHPRWLSPLTVTWLLHAWVHLITFIIKNYSANLYHFGSIKDYQDHLCLPSCHSTNLLWILFSWFFLDKGRFFLLFSLPHKKKINLKASFMCIHSFISNFLGPDIFYIISCIDGNYDLIIFTHLWVSATSG